MIVNEKSSFFMFYCLMIWHFLQVQTISLKSTSKTFFHSRLNLPPALFRKTEIALIALGIQSKYQSPKERKTPSFTFQFNTLRNTPLQTKLTSRTLPNKELNFFFFLSKNKKTETLWKNWNPKTRNNI